MERTRFFAAWAIPLLLVCGCLGRLAATQEGDRLGSGLEQDLRALLTVRRSIERDPGRAAADWSPHRHQTRNVLKGEVPLAIEQCAHLLAGTLPSSIATATACRHLQQRFNVTDNFLRGPAPADDWDAKRMARAEETLGDLSMQMPASLVSKVVEAGDKLYALAARVGGKLTRAHEAGRVRLARAVLTRRSMAEAVEEEPAAEEHTSHSKKRSTARRWAVGIALGVIAGALAAILLATVLRLVLFVVSRPHQQQGPVVFNTLLSPKMLLFLEGEDWLKGAEVVGVGGSGKVYKTHLENEMVVAVKSVSRTGEDQTGSSSERRQIQAELETLGCVRHRNLVVLMAYVHRPDSHLLVYEYMQNGSLWRALQRLAAGELEIPWPTRHKIAAGTCEGLSYLHFQSSPRIVHRDLKPSNILLDVNFRAHVSDFGLAKVIPGADTHVTTGVAGTVGYIAPEYSQTCRLTDKSDVYSFGVVLAVLLTGKDPRDQFFHSVPGGSIGSWLRGLLQTGNAKHAIDPKLLQGPRSFEEEIMLAAKIAVFCTADNPAERPTSEQVLVMLNQIRRVEEP